MKDTEVYSQISAPLNQLEEGLIHVLSQAEYPMENINKHLLQAAGKRIRPALFFLGLGLWEEKPERHLPVALAIELIHTATLVHDDVVDNAAARRGRPTVNEKFGNHAAVLTGDYLFAAAFTQLADYGNIQLIREMASLVRDMSEGEIQQQAECYRTDLSYQDYYRRIAKKTARFFSVCALSAGLVCRADERSLTALRDYGYNIGMAFQITDDLLDFNGDEVLTGKPKACDLRQGILTLPVLRLLEESSRSAELAGKIAERKVNEQLLSDIYRELGKYGCSEYVQAVAECYVREAVAAADKLPSLPVRKTLQQVAAFILNRGF